MKKITTLLLILLIAFSTVSLGMVSADDGDNPYFKVETITVNGGIQVNRGIINGPATPPPGFELQRKHVDLTEANTIQGSNSLQVPAFDWFFGCSATSGAMIAAYYDRNGYPNMYTGSTNGGVMPLDSSVWPDWMDSYGATYEQCPLTASRSGLDGRTGRGSIDDYWVKYNSSSSDPYITNGWTPHTFGNAIGDYMKTSQSAKNNSDGATSFYYIPESPIVLTCTQMEGYGIDDDDGTYGRKLFYEARGYTVTDCYSQNTSNNVSGGFSFAQYKAEIDAGRPVMLNLEGHTVVGVGYSDPDTVYIHDTWDYGTYSFSWSAGYSGMDLLSVSIVNLKAPETGNLSGVAADESSGNPIVGATVSAQGSSQTTSGTGGAYSLSLPVGVHTITVSKAGYLTSTITDVAVTKDSTTTLNVDLTLQAPDNGLLNGIIADNDSSTPIEGATVSVLGSDQTTSDEDGHYSLSLPAGVYTVTASALSYSPVTVSYLSISEGLTTTQNFNLEHLNSLWYAPASLEASILTGTNTTVALTLTNNSTSTIVYTLLEDLGGFQPNSTSNSSPETIQALDDYPQDARVAPEYAWRSASSGMINSINSAISLDEGFEGGVVPPIRWSEVVSDTIYNWQIMSVGTPNSGSYAADVVYDPSLSSQDEWLLSPEMDITWDTLSFWSAGSVYWCKGSPYDNCDLNIWLVVGDVGGGNDIFLGKGDDVWTTNFIWKQSVFDLAPYMLSEPVRIGFEYTGRDGAQVAIDDIRLTKGVDIPWLSTSPITGTIVAGQSQVIDITFDAATVTQTGHYTGTLHIVSDDIVNPDINVPVALTVFDEFAISGNAGAGSATLNYFNGIPMSTTADADGDYVIVVPAGWSGTITPSKSGYIFSPASRTYTNVLTDQPGQNYIARFTVYLPTIIR